MRPRYPSPSGFSYSFGPGPLTPAIKILILVNVAVFVVTWIGGAIEPWLWFTATDVLQRFQIWRVLTYMFVHDGLGHIFFNMLALWMFGVELERMWGTKYFVKFYFVAGIGAAVTTTLLSFVPLPSFEQLWYIGVVGASGAIYGILLAYAMYFPNRPVYVYAVFPIKVKYLVMIMGGIALLSSIGGPGGGIAHTAHLGGLAAGYLYLKGARMHLLSEIQYRYLKWRINRARRKFDVYSGGRADDVDRRVH
jgi:membrane associated rhomboid family serine protease